MRGERHPVPAQRRDHLGLVEIGMALDLVGDERLRGGADRLFQELHGEIGDADVAREALALCGDERRHALADRNLRVRPVDEQQVDVIDLQLAEARLD